MNQAEANRRIVHLFHANEISGLAVTVIVEYEVILIGQILESTMLD